MKLIGKLQDGTVFLEKGDENLLEFKTDEGNLISLFILPNTCFFASSIIFAFGCVNV